MHRDEPASAAVRRGRRIRAAALVAAALACSTPPRGVGGLGLPLQTTRRDTTVDVLHGVAVPDPYRWLESLGTPEVEDWVARERAATSAALSAAPLRELLAARLRALSEGESRSLPVRAGEHYLWTTTDGRRDQPVVVRGRTPQRHDEVVLDPNVWPDAGRRTLTGLAPSPGGRYLAYATSLDGSDWRTWRVLDLATRTHLPDEVAWTRFDEPAWSQDERGFFYGAYPASSAGWRPSVARMELRYHELGTDVAEDEVLFDDPRAPERTFAARVSDDGRWLVLSVFEGADPRNRLYFRDLTRRAGEFVRVFDAFDAEYEAIANEGSKFWIRTTRDAPRGRIVTVDAAAEGTAVVEVVPESRGVLHAAARVGGHLALERLVDLGTELEWVDLDGRPVATVALGDGAAHGLASSTATLARPLDGPRAGELFFGRTDTLTPFEVWRVGAGEGAATRVFAPATPFDAAAFASEVLHVTSADGTEVPVRVTGSATARATTDTPTVLYGYGGFDVPLRAAFTPAVAVWLELGGAHATAHVRGGGEFGEAWHAAGVRAAKPRAIEDFLAAAEGLVALGRTRPARLALRGESNGGLLAAAAAVRAPDRVGALIANAGVHDMLRYHLLGAGWAWTADYGTVDDPALFAVLRSYSPYHNVQAGVAYPPTLLTCADGDDRVPPSHSYKLAAALRAASGGRSPVLLRIEPRVGHAGPTSTRRRCEAAADEWAFLVAAFGLDTARLEGVLRQRAQ